jgi:hypothetical protein
LNSRNSVKERDNPESETIAFAGDIVRKLTIQTDTSSLLGTERVSIEHSVVSSHDPPIDQSECGGPSRQEHWNSNDFCWRRAVQHSSKHPSAERDDTHLRNCKRVPSHKADHLIPG